MLRTAYRSVFSFRARAIESRGTRGGQKSEAKGREGGKNKERKEKKGKEERNGRTVGVMSCHSSGGRMPVGKLASSG